MSRIQQGILNAMSEMNVAEDGELSAQFLFSKEFVGFQGHFKNNPILPGICKIQAALTLCEKARAQKLRLAEVTQAKFFLPVTCDQKISLHCRAKLTPEGALSVRALVKRNEEKIAMLQLTFLILQAQS